MKRLVAVLLIVSGIILGVFLINLWIFVKTPSGEVQQSFRFERGTPVGLIIRELADKGVISNSPLFKVYIHLKGAGGKIRAGEYTFPPRVRPAELLALLMKGDFTKQRVTIPEGWNVREIARYLGSGRGEALVDPEKFIQRCADAEFIKSIGLSAASLEGYLFPDTYEIYRPKNEEEVIRKFVEHFKEIYAKNFEARGREVGLSEQDVVILASIVEKETGNKEERPLVASVLLNRLKKGMPLAVDPTVIYGSGRFSGNLTRQDLARPGPYNTYLNPGLPPTAISNPGVRAIRAVLYPAETDYLYFVSKNDGTHQFSRTEEEHAAAVRKFQLNRSRQRAETRPTVPISPPESMNTMPETFPAIPSR